MFHEQLYLEKEVARMLGSTEPSQETAVAATNKNFSLQVQAQNNPTSLTTTLPAPSRTKRLKKLKSTNRPWLTGLDWLTHTRRRQQKFKLNDRWKPRQWLNDRCLASLALSLARFEHVDTKLM